MTQNLQDQIDQLSPAKRALFEQSKRTKATTETNSIIAPRAKDSASPLSSAQQRFWFLHQWNPDSPLYNSPLLLTLQGELNEAALQQALDALVARHAVLRTIFQWADGQATQIPKTSSSVSLRMISSDILNSDWIHQEACRPFDLKSGLLLHAALVHAAPNEYQLLITVPHIVFDGWSRAILLRDLSLFYNAFVQGTTPELPALPIEYGDYAVWQQEQLASAATQTHLRYWKNQLAGTPQVLSLPTDRPRPAIQSYRGARQSFRVSRELSDGVQQLAQREGVTLFMVLLAAFQTVLYRYTAQSDIVVGAPIANRTQAKTEELVGCFINTLALRSDLLGDPAFRELLVRVRGTCLDAFAHQDLPFETLVDELRPERDLSRAPIVQVMLALQNAPKREFPLLGLTCRVETLNTRTSKLDLILNIETDEEGLDVWFEYATDLFDSGTIARLQEHFLTLLAGVVAEPNRRISELPLMTASERHQILVEWNATETDFPSDRCIHDLFEEQVAQAPDAVAVVFGHATLTYRELNERANQLAHYLQKQHVGPNTFVGILVERSVEMLVGLLGILKAGGAYLPMNPTDPDERLELLLGEAKTPLLLTQDRFAKRVASLDTPYLCLDTQWDKIASESTENIAFDRTSESLAYAIYTSGSTGRPKAVLVPHRGVVRLVKNTDYVSLTSEDIFLQLAPLSFDASTFEIWGSLLNGARLVVLPAHAPSLAELGTALKTHGVTTLWLTAGLFSLMVEERLNDLQGVRQLLAGGDVLPILQVNKLVQELPHCRLINGYGPTENTTFTCCYTVNPWGEIGSSVPIGRPISNTQVYVLDADLQPVPIGIPGELYIGGAGLALGYLGRPDLTKERFIPNPFSGESDARMYKSGDQVRWLPNGNLEFLGRLDQQVKIRGFRIELGEIETVLASHPDIKEALVIVREASPGDKRLIASLVCRSTAVPSDHALRAFLKARLPEYMIPSEFQMLEVLPLTANGKRERQASETPRELSPEERQQVLVDWNQTERDYPTDQTLATLFVAQAARTPNAIAVVDSQQELTYRDLEAQSNRLARYLQSLGVGPEVRVGICLPRSADMVVALLGILKSGGAYVPLDPSYPQERNAFVLADAQASVLVTTASLLSLLPECEATVLCLDDDAAKIASYSETNLDLTASPQNLAYVIYTSGSTGQPKGVAIEHRSAATLVQWAREVYDDVALSGVLAATSLCFDLSVFELFVTLSWGGSVLIAENALHLATLPYRDRVTLVNTVPSAIAELARLNAIPESVRVVNLAGELLPQSLVETLYRHSYLRQLYDLYGPSEDTTYSTVALRRAGGHATIGRPIANTQAYVLDELRQPVSVGVSGELYLAGDGLARGYLHRPDLTDERFVPNPFHTDPDARMYRTGDSVRWLPDGNLEYLGRLDQQVKIRGFRIELGEIESVLTNHEAVEECLVMAREDTPGDQRLVAYVVHKANHSVASIELAVFLKAKLPDYMIPSAFVFLDAMPMTPNGKRDRKQLPRPDPGGASIATEYVAPRNPLEETLCAIWADVLTLTRVGIRDNFFELGGHSLLATQVIVRMHGALEKEIPLRLIFEEPTVAEMAIALQTLQMPRESPLTESVVNPIVLVVSNQEYAPPQNPLQTTLQQIWQDLIGRQPIGIHDNFFDLGGHSLMAMVMIERIEQETGCKISIAALFGKATIEQLATAILEANSEAISQPLIPVQPLGSKPAFYFLHGDLNGGGLYCRTLAKYLGPDQPFYALPPLGLNGTEVPLSIQEAAAQHIAIIRAFQPEGPYRLGGFCNGGLIAYEMARQLEAQGQRTEAVILIHASAKNIYFRPLHKVFHGVGRRLGVSEKTRQYQFVKLRDRLTRTQGGYLNPNSESDDDTLALYYLRMGDYIPGRYSGRVTLLWPIECGSRQSFDPTKGWGRVAESVDVVVTPGGHLSCLTEHVQALADQIRVSLEKIV